ncbi:response regulator [Candidatus Riflebacteria bacterium]
MDYENKTNEELILEIKRMQKHLCEMERDKTEGEEVIKFKNKFFSLVAGDLKTPLTIISGFINILGTDPEFPLSVKQRNFINQIMKNTNQMTDMVHELLDISRLHTGEVRPRPIFFDAKKAIEETIENLCIWAEQKEIAIQNEIPRGVRIYADKGLFCDVVSNLVSNAVKFCKKDDFIAIFLSMEHQSTIGIRDTGTGIDDDSLPNIFKYDEKTSKTGTSGEVGTGLGLPYCMEIIKAHDGKLWVETAPGEGTTFFIQLPQVRPRILLVDDQIMFLKLEKEVLKQLDVEIIEAGNGIEALKVIEEQKPHLVICDIIMPKMDGFEFLQTIKKDPATRQIPIIMLTSNECLETRQKAFDLDADDFINKPIQESELIPRVRKFVI